jgi:phospholipase D1/2
MAEVRPINEERRGAPDGVLEEGRTVWKIARAGRVAVLVDAADYFAALRSAMASATTSIVVLGWDIDSRTPLVGRSGVAEDGAPATLLPFVLSLVRKRPELDVRVLLWDYSLLYALDREPLPSLNLKWRTPPQVKVELDSCLPLGACHHQKLVVIDGCLAFCGGLDLTIRRWDTAEHRPGHPARVDPDGKSYPPFHDIQMLVDGEAARRLAEVSARRWQDATGEELAPINAEATAHWPEHVIPDCEAVDVGIARTLPATEERPGVPEVLELYLASIRSAQRYIYIETQYLTSDAVADALHRRLHEVPDLELLVITPRAPENWLEKRTMGAGQQRVMQKLTHVDFSERVRFLYPWAGCGKDCAVLVHAKLMIVDDAWLRVGSANLNNRSMGVDTECDLIVRAATDEHRKEIRAVLHRLLGEHLGLGVPQVAERLDQTGSLARLTSTRWSKEKGLEPLALHGQNQTLAETLNLVADPEAPLQPTEFVGDMFGATGGERFAISGVLKLVAISVALLLLLLAWNYTPLAELADPEAIVRMLYGVRNEWWIYPAIVAAFVFGGMILFPVTVLIAVTGLLLGPWSGWFTAMLGSMVSGWAGHAAGVWLGGSSMQHISSRAFRAVSGALRKQGIVAVAALRMVPVAPYTVVNMAMGAAGVPSRTFLAGTFIGLLPGTFVLTMLGDRMREVWRDPQPANAALVVLLIVLWLGLAFALQQLVTRLRNRER